MGIDFLCTYSMRKEGSASGCDGAEGSGKTWMFSVSETEAAVPCSLAGAGISSADIRSCLCIIPL